MKTRYILSSLLLSCFIQHSSAADFISTEPARHLLTIGARIGVNASNRTFPKDKFDAWNVNSWGTGVGAGIIVGINIREYLSITPGLFYESRSSNYSYSEPYVNNRKEDDFFTQLGHVRTYNLIAPLMLTFKFNLSDNIRWLVEAGPYGQIKLRATDSNKIQLIEQPTPESTVRVSYAQSHFYDYGIKMGMGLMLNDRYSFNIHYLAGARDVWGVPKGGLNKSWTFTIGYDFGIL